MKWFFFTIVHICYFALIGYAVHHTKSAAPLWGLVFLPFWALFLAPANVDKKEKEQVTEPESAWTNESLNK